MGGATAQALVESALGQAAMLERFGFTDICISVKSSSVPVTVAAYRLLSEQGPAAGGAGDELGAVLPQSGGPEDLLCYVDLLHRARHRGGLRADRGAHEPHRGPPQAGEKG